MNINDMNKEQAIDFIDAIADVFSIGHEARSESVILSNVVNASNDEFCSNKKEWIDVFDELPTTNEVVLVKFESVLGTIERCTAKFHMVPRHAFENPPLDPTWYVYPSGGHTLKPTHWSEIKEV